MKSFRVVISGSVVCWKGLCSENTTWSKLRIADRTRRKKKNKNEKKKNATLRSPHFVSVQPHLHHLRVQAWSLFLSLSLSFSKTCWIYFASSPTAWPTERGRLFVHKMAPLTQAWTLKPSPSPSFPPLFPPKTRPSPTACSSGSVDRRCHWNTLEITRDWPNDLDLCTVLYACCCPEKKKKKNAPSPSLIATFNITENILCFVLKTTLKTFRQAHARGCTTCQRLHEIDNIFVLFLTESWKRK